MSKESKELVQLINKYQRGVDESFDAFCEKIETKVYALVGMVYEKEENRNKLVKHVFAKLKKELEEVEVDADSVDLWVAQFCTRAIFNIYSQKKDSLIEADSFDAESEEEYDFNAIGYDDEFIDCVQYYNNAINDNDFDTLSAITKLSKTQILIYELYCYAQFSVDELEEMLDVDGIYIGYEITKIKNELLAAYEPIANKLAGSSVIADTDVSDSEDNDFISRIYSALPEKTMIVIGSAMGALIIILTVVTVLLVGKTGRKKDEPVTTLQPTTVQTTTEAGNGVAQTGAWKNTNTTPAALADSPTIKPAQKETAQQETTTAKVETTSEENKNKESSSSQDKSEEKTTPKATDGNKNDKESSSSKGDDSTQKTTAEPEKSTDKGAGAAN